MRGTISRDGTLTITLNTQWEILPAPHKVGEALTRMWYPCEQCGGLQNVESSVVTFNCSACAEDLKDSERMERIIYQGRVLCEDAQGGCGTVPFDVHCLQMDDQQSWVRASWEDWQKRGLQDARGL